MILNGIPKICESTAPFCEVVFQQHPLLNLYSSGKNYLKELLNYFLQEKLDFSRVHFPVLKVMSAISIRLCPSLKLCTLLLVLQSQTMSITLCLLFPSALLLKNNWGLDRKLEVHEFIALHLKMPLIEHYGGIHTIT